MSDPIEIRLVAQSSRLYRIDVGSPLGYAQTTGPTIAGPEDPSAADLLAAAASVVGQHERDGATFLTLDYVSADDGDEIHLYFEQPHAGVGEATIHGDFVLRDGTHSSEIRVRLPDLDPPPGYRPAGLEEK